MKAMKWRDLIELVSIVSIVAGLMLVAWEIRQANKIARAEISLQLSAQYNEFNSARFEDPEVARLSLLLMNPDPESLTAVERSMMSGAAWHFGNIFGSAQIAYDNGILNDQDLAMYQSHLEWMLTYMPGLVPEFELMWSTVPGMHDVRVWEPLRRHMEEKER